MVLSEAILNVCRGNIEDNRKKRTVKGHERRQDFLPTSLELLSDDANGLL